MNVPQKALFQRMPMPLKDFVINEPITTVLLVLLIPIFIAFIVTKKKHVSCNNDDNTIPEPEGHIPLLGHALLYKKNPVSFLFSQYKRLGSIFRIDLAGRRMIVICASGKENAVNTVVSSPERVMSATEVLPPLGFDSTLGHANVNTGGAFHKKLIKNKLSRGKKSGEWCGNIDFEDNNISRTVMKSLQSSFDSEFTKTKNTDETVVIDDFFPFIRRCLTQVILEICLGSTFVTGYRENPVDDKKELDSFVDDSIKLIEMVEEATAATVALPRWLAEFVILKPVKQFRLNFQRKVIDRMEKALEVAGSSNEAGTENESNDKSIGPWLQAFRDDKMSSDVASELVVGLLFSGTKNPSNAACQSFIFMMTDGTDDERSAIRKEAVRLQSEPTVQTLKQCHAIRRCCLETLRMTAHSIGAVRVAKKRTVLQRSDKPEAIVEAGDLVALAHNIPNHDKTTWGPTASQYDPNRKEWVVEKKKEEADDKEKMDFPHFPDEYKFATFSRGLHRCPGRDMTLLFVGCIVSTLCLYDAELVRDDKGNVPSLCFKKATVAQRDGKVSIRLRKRK